MMYYPEPDEVPGRHYDAATERIGAKRERERIVAWLRGIPLTPARLWADKIERGEHEAMPEPQKCERCEGTGRVRVYGTVLVNACPDCGGRGTTQPGGEA